MKVGPYLTSYTKINSEWIKDLKVKPETIKLLEENIGDKLRNDFLDLIPKQRQQKQKQTTWV